LYLIVLFVCLLFIVFNYNAEPHIFNFSYTSESKYENPGAEGVNFDLNRDLMVFLHIQKTGGSDFDRNFIKHVQIYDQNLKRWHKACKNLSTSVSYDTFQARKVKFKKYECKSESSKQNWYFSRQTFGWVCGLHADYTQLKHCVPKMYPKLEESSIKYFTILRDPIKRYLSEWLHVKRGATWIRRSAHNQSSFSQSCLNDLYKQCFMNQTNWPNVTLEEFIDCKFNLASNRQTRMLAFYDSKFSACDLFSTNQNNEQLIYEKAIETLDSISFFALNEFQYLSKNLFEKTFRSKLKFDIDFSQTNASLSENVYKELNVDLKKKIEIKNSFDLKLYKYAVNLFFKRLKEYKILY
jgi:hypothetical protein